jgi:hypothetical protein
MEAPPCLALLLFFGTLLVLPQSSHAATRYYTFNVSAFQACMSICEVMDVDEQVNDVTCRVNSCVRVCSCLCR